MLCHWDDVPEQPIETGHLRAHWVDLGAASGTVHIGARRQRLAPRAQGTPAHVHDAEEEICFVLAGSGLSWQDGTTYAIGAGDALLHRPGGAAHCLVAGADGLTAIMFGERRPVEVGRVPRTGAGWIGTTWTDVGTGRDPWAREVAAGRSWRSPTCPATSATAASSARRSATSASRSARGAPGCATRRSRRAG